MPADLKPHFTRLAAALPNLKPYQADILEIYVSTHALYTRFKTIVADLKPEQIITTDTQRRHHIHPAINTLTEISNILSSLAADLSLPPEKESP